MARRNLPGRHSPGGESGVVVRGTEETPGFAPRPEPEAIGARGEPMTDIDASATAAAPARRGEAPTVVVPVENQGAFWDDRGSLLACLREPTPRIPPVFGYDEVGSELFEAITRLPT